MLLQALALVDPEFARKWHKSGESLQEALAAPVDLTLESLARALANGVLRNDTDASAIEDLGFGCGLWNGCEEAAVHVSLRFGAHADVPVPNYLVVRLPNIGSASKRLFNREKLRQIIETIAELVDPDRARASSYEMDTAVYSQLPYASHRVGWLTYVSDRYGSLPALPPECLGEHIGRLGNAITVATITGFASTNSAHVSAIRRLSEILKQAGMLDPLQKQ